jgi:Xaa-Pro aminopeptidase
MRADIDRLMAERGMDAIVVMIDEVYSPQVDFLAGRAHVHGGLLVKAWQAPPVFVVSGMEIEEAKATGLEAHSWDDFGYREALNANGGDIVAARVVLWGRCLAQFGVANGKIGVYGISKIEKILPLLDALREAYPQYQFVGEGGTSLFDAAVFTKDEEELRRIASVAERTSEVVRATWDFIASHRTNDAEVVVDRAGTPLTIGDVKQFVMAALMERGLEDTGMTFAQGRDGAFPHSRGTDEEPLRLGETLVFDLFPRETGGGFHHDITRTWCIGYAPDEVRETYQTVMEAFDLAHEMFAVGRPVREMQEAVMQYFEDRNHPTWRQNPTSKEGYIHSLGHGVGLEIHEGYTISHLNRDDVFAVGNVITIEPGLYYPEKGYGVRVEDTLYVAPDGQLLTLTDVPKDLVLPLRG